MESYVGFIHLFAGNFAPLDFALCQGQIINIQSNTTLYSIIGTYFGGNGSTTFGLPDFRGRIPVGVGTGNGLSAYTLGETGGQSTHTLLLTEIAAHSHPITYTVPITASSATLNAAATGSSASPAGKLLGTDGSETMYGIGPLVAMASTAVSLTVTGPQPTAVTLGSAGSSGAHNNMQPSLGLIYIICTAGVYPTRN